MEYHFSKHINNIHDIFLHGALNLNNLLITVFSGQAINHKKNNITKTHMKKQRQWCKEEGKGERKTKDYLQN